MHSELLNAYEKQDIEHIKKILADPNVDINQPLNNIGDTLLHLVCRNKVQLSSNNQTDLLTSILTRPGTDPFVSNTKKMSAFFLACMKNQINAVNVFLTQTLGPVMTALIQQSDNMLDTTAFHIACLSSEAIARRLLEDPRSEPVLNKTDSAGRTPFGHACSKNYVEIASLLLTKIDIQTPDLRGYTPFSLACTYGHLALVKLLLRDPRNKAVLNRPNKLNQTPFFLACYNGHPEVVKLLLANPDVDIQLNDNLLSFALRGSKKKESIEIFDLLMCIPQSAQFCASSTDFDWAPLYQLQLIANQLMTTHRKEADNNRVLINGAQILDCQSFKEVEAIIVSMGEANPHLQQYVRETRQHYGKHFFNKLTKAIEQIHLISKSIFEASALQLFGLIVLLCDKYFMLKSNTDVNTSNIKVWQFFNITLQLPMDMQMVLANRFKGSSQNNISSSTMEEVWEKLLPPPSTNAMPHPGN